MYVPALNSFHPFDLVLALSSSSSSLSPIWPASPPFVRVSRSTLSAVFLPRLSDRPGPPPRVSGLSALERLPLPSSLARLLSRTLDVLLPRNTSDSPAKLNRAEGLEEADRPVVESELVVALSPFLTLDMLRNALDILGLLALCPDPAEVVRMRSRRVLVDAWRDMGVVAGIVGTPSRREGRPRSPLSVSDVSIADE